MWMHFRGLVWYLKTLIGILLLVLLVIVLAPTFWRILYPLPYRASIEKYAIANNLDPRLVAAVIKVESNFRLDATSPKDARGLMQVLPSTGAWIATQIGLPNYNDAMLYDPEVNIRLGCWYLNNLITQFGGQMPVALASYNGGRGNVQNWLSTGIWTGDEADISQIPFSETRGYVWKVLRVYAVYQELYPLSR
ncbi:MAG: lytic transglycosylase domain-containing protein [Bacillota bacterium]|nr:lytic transglycosylase domain-containing protein [Bacillota bacterium]